VEEEVTTDSPAPEVAVRQPEVLVPLWWLLGLLCLAEALHELIGLGSPDDVFGLGIGAALQVAAAILCLARVAYEPRGRRAWAANPTAATAARIAGRNARTIHR